MAPRKLSDSDKSELIDLYKQPGQTTTTLAEQFGVSNSTISRILKSTIPPEEYRELISQKRMASSDKAVPATKAKAVKQKAPAKEISSPKVEPSASDDTALLSDEAADDALEQTPPPKLKSASPESAPPAKTEKGTRRRRRSNAKQNDDEQLPLLTDRKETAGETSPEILEKSVEEKSVEEKSAEEKTAEEKTPVKKAAPTRPAAPKLVSAEAEDDDDDDDDLEGLDETLGDDFGDDDDLDEDDDDDDEGEVDMPKPKLQLQNAMEIMPLGSAVLPKPCYLVVDMRSELITRPLSEFADLGQVPSAEEKSKTLPVFDNHRVARRFSRNKQRVIKVPDGNLIMRTSPYLQAKGITRLLVDGQVFDLASVD